MTVKIVISEFMDEAAIAGLRDGFEVLYDPDLVDRPADLAEALAPAAGLIVRNRTQVTAALLDGAPGLKVVGRLGVGLDNIDLAACRVRQVAVCPALGANDLAVAEYALTSAMALLRGAYFSQSAMLTGTWPRGALMGRESEGKILGLVGFGSIAREVARRALAVGFTVIAYDPYLAADHAAWDGVEKVDLTDLAERSDAISLHVPLNEATRHLVDAGFLARMKPGAVLVNAARGGVVDEEALAQSLRDGHLAGAALDVFECEPLTEAAAAKFQGIDNLILTPHIAGVTQESNIRVSAVTAEAVRSVLEKML